VPFETRSPFVTSGIRIGTPAATTHGLKEAEMAEVADFIAEALANVDNIARLNEIKSRVNSLMKRFPFYSNRLG
jgi:glycine hydroxymethyltransferase